MSSISIIGVGNMARALGARALDGGNTVEIIGRDAAKAAALADALGGRAGTRAPDTAPDGDIVILAVPYANTVPVVRQYGDRLAGKIIVDISNPFAPDFSGLLTPEGSSAAQQIAAVAPAGARVVKGFNTIFAHVLASDPEHRRRLDVFLAGDDAQAKQDVSSLVDSLALRPLDTGPLAMAGRLEQAGLLVMGVAHHGTRHFDFALGITVFD